MIIILNLLAAGYTAVYPICKIINISVGLYTYYSPLHLKNPLRGFLFR